MRKQQKSNLALAIITAFITAGLFFPGLIVGGDMEPSGQPGPTMHTIDEIYDVLTTGCPPSTIESSVPKTGQTTSYAPGDDGDQGEGVIWPNPRFTDNGDGTVTDNLTGLIWLKDANCFEHPSWADALVAVNSLANGTCSLTDGSTPGDWRIPNVKELQSLIHYGFSNPPLPDTAGTGKWQEDVPFSNVESRAYVSSTTPPTSPGSYVWYVNLNNLGSVEIGAKGDVGGSLWPVRGPATE